MLNIYKHLPVVLNYNYNIVSYVPGPQACLCFRHKCAPFLTLILKVVLRLNSPWALILRLQDHNLFNLKELILHLHNHNIVLFCQISQHTCNMQLIVADIMIEIYFKGSEPCLEVLKITHTLILQLKQAKSLQTVKLMACNLAQ